MKNDRILSKIFRKSQTAKVNPAPDLSSYNGPDALIEESLFKRLLCLERRRTERSGHPFVLMLLNIEGLSDGADPRQISRIGATISSATRDTDVTGWYRTYSTIGVIFTTLTGTNRSLITSAILDKVYKGLSEKLELTDIDRIQITFHFFPEENGTGRTGTSSDQKLYPDLIENLNRKPVSNILKRTLDIAGSLLALIVLLPVFLIIAILLKVSSKGPILFKQKRLGKFSQEFTFLKFRSMYVGNDPEIHRQYVEELIRQKGSPGAQSSRAEGIYKITNDPRITPIGRFLRKTSLDELPQFLNVLTGDMSLVGPRPPIPYEYDCYGVWHRRRVLEAKPGITGLWQVKGRSRTTFDEMVRIDLQYIRESSFWLDLKILVRTPFVLFSGDGAY